MSCCVFSPQRRRPRQRLRPRLLRLNDDGDYDVDDGDDCGNLVASTTTAATWWLRPRQPLRPRLLRLNLVIAAWLLRPRQQLRPRQRLRPRLLRLNLVIAAWWLRARQRLRPRLLRLNDGGHYDVGDGDDCGGHGHDCGHGHGQTSFDLRVSWNP